MHLSWRHIIFPTVIAFFLITSLSIYFINKNPLPNYTLPKINITLHGTDLNTVLSQPKTIKYYNNTLSLSNIGNTIHYNNVEIKLRGNSTWGWPKNPYQIKFNSKVGLLGMQPAKKWILLANFMDKTNLRTDTAFFFEKILSKNNALNGNFVELYIDNEYQGLYYLTEKIEIAKNRIKLTDELGVIVELENLHASEENCYLSKEGSCLIVHDLVVKSNEERAMSSFVDNFNILEQAAKNKDYETVRSIADVTSFAEYYILSDLSVNPDAYSSSLFFYKNGELDKIHIGPGWDFDLAFGNRVWSWAETKDFYSPETSSIIEKYAFGGRVYDESSQQFQEISPNTIISKLMYWLYQIPEFKEEVRKIYIENILDQDETILQHIETQAEIINQAAIRDKKFWREYDEQLIEVLQLQQGTLYEFYGPERAYQLEVNDLLNWVKRRLNHLKQKYTGVEEQQATPYLSPSILQ